MKHKHTLLHGLDVLAGKSDADLVHLGLLKGSALLLHVDCKYNFKAAISTALRMVCLAYPTTQSTSYICNKSNVRKIRHVLRHAPSMGKARFRIQAKNNHKSNAQMRYGERKKGGSQQT